MAKLSRRGSVVGAIAGLVLASCRSTPNEPEATAASPRGRTKPPRSIASLRILSYNVLADPVALEERIPALFRTMRTADADVLALQEVAPWFVPMASEREWMAYYQPAMLLGEVARPNGQSIFSRHEVVESHFIRLPGNQGRTLLVSRIALGPQEHVVVATTHMESFLEDGAIRAAQLDAIFAELERFASDKAVTATVFCGDLNFGDGEQPDSAHLDPSFVDLWDGLHPGTPGYTWNIEKSEMARRGSFAGERSRRLDRILLRAKAWRPHSVEIIGGEPVRPGDRGLFPSDHFGLVGEIRRA